MSLFAAFVLEPTSIAAWLVVGLVCGWLAGKLMEAPSYGLIGDVVLSTIGALVGGGLFALFGPSNLGLGGSTLAALVGACVLIAGARGIGAFRQE